MNPDQKDVWFISLEGDLDRSGGGVQLCTHEYWRTLELAGFRLIPKPFTSDRSFLAGIKRRLWPRSFENMISTSEVRALQAQLAANPPAAVFFNRVNAAPLARHLRAAAPTLPFILLSHGLMIVDEIHIRALPKRGRPFSRTWNRWWLGDILLKEKSQRPDFDLVFALTEEECALERWLGSKQAAWIPRVAKPAPLDWHPIAGRVGFVGTLSHPPSRDALETTLEELARLEPTAPFELRIVGSPSNLGDRWQKRFSFVKFLGALTDEELAIEASTWCCFSHPLFQFARGCSTKLAVALGWGIPILTTSAGARGYSWRNGGLSLADEPPQFARELLRLSSIDACRENREQVMVVAASMPTQEEVVATVRTRLRTIGLFC
jgi:hypothetical protein